jgi:polar amino acid transport system ATP-binding protein
LVPVFDSSTKPMMDVTAVPTSSTPRSSRLPCMGWSRCFTLPFAGRYQRPARFWRKSSMSLIAITDVTKSFGSNVVLRGVSLDVDPGEVIAIIGKSGSGKSTLLRCINGLETIDQGSIMVAGAQFLPDAIHLRNLRQKVGMIFQSFNLFPHLSVGRNVMLAPRVVKKVSEHEADELARKYLDRVGLLHKFDALPDELSGGQQQRVAIARALAMQPQALLCDEITSALDPELVNEVLAVVGELAKEGMTLLMVTHEMRFAREVCDRVVFMHQGKVHEIGPPDEVFNQPKTAELRQFLGMIA